MKHIYYNFLFILVALTSCSNASKPNDPIPKHETFKIQSKQVGEKRVINVWTPENYKAVNEFGYVGYNYIGRADFILPRGTMIFNVKVTVGYIGLINENTNTVVPFYPFGRASYNHSFFSGKAGGDVIQRPIINY